MGPRRLALLAAFLAALAGAEARAEVRRLVVVHTNDLHGQLYPGPDYLTPGEPRPRMGGIAAVAAVIEAERERARAAGAGFLALDAGDFYHGSPEGDATRGAAVVEIMNLLGYDAACVGNHEFADGVANVEALARAARFPLLAGNVRRDDRDALGTDEEPWMPASIVRETGGLRVAVIGVTHEATPRMNRPKDTAGLKFDPADRALAALVAGVRALDGADLVLALTHLGSEEDLKLAAAVRGLALVVGGHDHVALDPAPLVGETLVVQAGEHGRRVGRVVLDYDTEQRRVVRREAVLLNLHADAPRSATVAAAAEARRRREQDEVVGAAADDIRRAFTGESAAGALACEAIREALGADLAIVNQTTVRGGFARGPVTRRDIYACVPFRNELVRIEVPGPELLELLEHALARPGGPNLEVAGLALRYDPERPRGERILEARVGGAPLAVDRMYKLGTTDFYAERTDMLRRKPKERAGLTPADALAARFAKGLPIAAPDPVRIAPAARREERP